MTDFPRRHLVAGSIAVGVYVAGAIAIHSTTADAFDLNSSLGPSGRGASLSEQTGRMGEQRDRDRADRAREILARHPHMTVTTSRTASADTHNGGSSDYGGDRTGGGGGPK
jgi:hypothetical protein